MSGNGGKEGEVNLEIDEETGKGIYANFAVVSHTATEFIIDFAFVFPGQPRNKIRSRIISSPQHTKRFLLALQDNMKKFEEKSGLI
ncbi:MAG: DUF3467 domain-containing protein [Candidatus Firestonebacteria bacterium]